MLAPVVRKGDTCHMTLVYLCVEKRGALIGLLKVKSAVVCMPDQSAEVLFMIPTLMHCSVRQAKEASGLLEMFQESSLVCTAGS